MPNLKSGLNRAANHNKLAQRIVFLYTSPHFYPEIATNQWQICGHSPVHLRHFGGKDSIKSKSQTVACTMAKEGPVSGRKLIRAE